MPTSAVTPMRRRLLACTLVLLISALPSCAHRGSSDAGEARRERPRRRADMLTIEDFGNRDWSSVYELVRALRPNWLNVRGSDTINGDPVDVRVLLDGVPLGNASELHAQSVVGIQYLQYFDPISASGRWGLGYGKGAIYISMRKP